MSWQGNECFVLRFEGTNGGMESSMLNALDDLLFLYDEKGAGWYLFGYFDACNEEEDFDEPDWSRGIVSAWLPNPFIAPDVLAINIGCAHDFMNAAFETWDCSYEAVAYAGDGREPLQHVIVYGKEYDMRPDNMMEEVA